MKTYYVGLATTFHDPALAIIDEKGEIIFAEATERHYQDKRAMGCLPDSMEWANQLIKQVTDPSAKFVIAGSWNHQMHRFLKLLNFLGITSARKIFRYDQRFATACATKHEGLYVCLMQLNSMNGAGAGWSMALAKHHNNRNIEFRNYPHHWTHAMGACRMSGFEETACMVVDSNGQRGSISYFGYKNGSLNEIKEIKGAASLGALYTAFTGYCGFQPDKGEEWKVMGLAPYGKPIEAILEVLRELVIIDGINIKYRSKKHYQKLVAHLEAAKRSGDQPIIEAADLAATGQAFYEEAMSRLINNFHGMTGGERLVLSGGCGLNSSYNGKIIEQTPFEEVFIPCAPGDDGNAVGAAYLAYHADFPTNIPLPKRQSPYLGSRLSPRGLHNMRTFGRLPKIRQLPDTLYEETAKLLAEGKLVGWARGRAEFGPRALGNRSILADPRAADMKDKINAKVKFREEYRPFAPSILHEFGPEYFENYQETPYMERTLRFKEEVRDRVPAVVHVNGTGRLQSVSASLNEPYYKLIKAFYAITGVPILLNTSFNVMGKPIIHSVEDALSVFFTSGLDALVLEDMLIEKPDAEEIDNRTRASDRTATPVG
ncbi:carbamoyltransferase family protein [Acanthopleuribacter pedis]|uniref:Carbamoyltransferase n=1 Tax=Acanthopleuribacter pedis TaxID=442870 RepID=A0A8J7QBD6_9BACT|nr:carbamoyltransferase C-terminal domain-containing protein [Acanthopleuribacter pedis]MBO1317801.1 hypothetical protein [Acanthopleuribacter pedis]